MTDDQPDPKPDDDNPWDSYIVLLAAVASACISVLMIISTYGLARFLLGL